jgi:Helix-loop-helix DNA-binding domain
MRVTLADEPNWVECNFTSGSSTFQTDALDYLDIGSSVCEDQILESTPVVYQTGPFTFSELPELEFDAFASDHTSQSTCRRNSSSVPGGAQTISPILSVRSEELSQRGAGQASQFTPQLCGPDAACLTSSNLDLEDCTSVPCISEPTKWPESTHSSHPSYGSIVETKPSWPFKSRSKKQSKNAQQGLQRWNSEAVKPVNAKSDSKKLHSLVERRYRENLNSGIALLHLTLMKTERFGSNMPKSQHQNLRKEQQNSFKMRKAGVIREAVAYAHQTEVDLRHMADEIDLLTTRVKQLEGLVKCEDCVLMKQLLDCSL